MNRSKLSENLSRLNETEIDILTFVTKLSIDWFNDLTNSDDKVEYALRTPFSYYFELDVDNNPHPMKKVYDKITDGIYGGPLFDFVFYNRGEDFEVFAKRINKLWVSYKRKYVLIALKAIGERDFQVLVREREYADDLTLKEYFQKFEEFYLEDLLSWLDERDLKTILLFCGED